jgi:hypothetical protein
MQKTTAAATLSPHDLPVEAQDEKVGGREAQPALDVQQRHPSHAQRLALTTCQKANRRMGSKTIMLWEAIRRTSVKSRDVGAERFLTCRWAHLLDEVLREHVACDEATDGEERIHSKLGPEKHLT